MTQVRSAILFGGSGECFLPPAWQDKGGDYVSNYRNFKYYETLFELFAKQYEVARVDESREGAVIQVLDVAHRPSTRVNPRRP